MLPVVFLGGAIATGVSYIQDKNFPLPFAKPRNKLVSYLEDDSQTEPKADDRFIEQLNLRYQKFFQEHVDPLLGASRQQDLAEIAQTTELAERPDGYINRRLGYSLACLVFALAGTVSSPSFLVIC